MTETKMSYRHAKNLLGSMVCKTSELKSEYRDALILLLLKLEEEEWRDASEVLPEDEREVLVLTCSKSGLKGIDKGYCFNNHFVHRGHAPVTHWKPLPEFPEE